MQHRLRRIWSAGIFVAACAAFAAGACSKGTDQPASSSGSASTLTIAMIPKGTTHTFWQSIHAGANKAAKELGIELIWRGPLREDDRDSQVSEVEGFISRGVSGIVLAPLDEAALVGPVDDAMSKKIPVVIFDSGLKGENYVSFVATDNFKGGQLGGERLVESMGGKGKVVLLRYAEGHDSTTKREEGFLAAMKAHPTVEVISSNQYVGTDVEEAYKRTESILSTYRKPDGSLRIDGIFCANESSSFAAMRVLKDNGWAGKLHFVGFDSSENLVKGLQEGSLDGLVLQDPVKMGYLAIKTLVGHIKGEKVERRIDTGVAVATRENMDKPGMKELVHPDLAK
jgi:ribose transport system substrate-binding protein